MTGQQDIRFQALVKRFVTPIRYMKMKEDETYASFLDRRLKGINNASEQFNSMKDLLKLMK